MPAIPALFFLAASWFAASVADRPYRHGPHRQYLCYGVGCGAGLGSVELTTEEAQRSLLVLQVRAGIPMSLQGRTVRSSTR